MPRFQLDISEEDLQEIEAMMEKTGVSTKKEFINNAVTLLNWAIRQREQGNSIAAIDEAADIYRDLEMPILSKVKPDAGKRPAARRKPSTSN